MDTSVFNIEPDELIYLEKINKYNFDFLDDIFNFDITPYYYLILSKENYKLKNLYNYLYLRILKINIKFSQIGVIDCNKYIKYYETFNELIKNYINKDKIKAIIIMNAIQHFYIPNI